MLKPATYVKIPNTVAAWTTFCTGLAHTHTRAYGLVRVCKTENVVLQFFTMCATVDAKTIPWRDVEENFQGAEYHISYSQNDTRLAKADRPPAQPRQRRHYVDETIRTTPLGTNAGYG